MQFRSNEVSSTLAVEMAGAEIPIRSLVQVAEQQAAMMKQLEMQGELLAQIAASQKRQDSSAGMPSLGDHLSVAPWLHGVQ